MKAALIVKQGTVEVRDIHESPMGDYDARCEMLYGATCFGTDQHLIHGRIFDFEDYPYILGHESVGRVVEIGKKVRNFHVGDLITRVGALPSPDGEYNLAFGGFVETGIARDHMAMAEDGLPEQDWKSFQFNQVVPDGIDAATATMFITWRETLSYLKRMGVSTGSNILIFGSGANALSFVAHSKILKAANIVCVGNPNREEKALQAGVKQYIDYKAENLAELIVLACSDGVDFIIDVVGKKGLLDMALPNLKSDGKMAIYGLSDDRSENRIDLTNAKGSFTYYQGGYDEAEVHDEVIAYVQQGLLDAGIWMDIENPFPLKDINKAYEAVENRKLVKALVSLTR